MDIELITLVNSFQNTIAINNILIKNKILRKLEMIHTMRINGFPLMNFPQSKCNSIIQELKRIDKEGDIVKYSRSTNNSDTNKLLGNILHNAYQASGYDIILSNAPTYGTTVLGDFIKIDSEAIYDTLEQYATHDAIVLVYQISANTYLIKMDNSNNARALCSLLNEKQMENKIIKVEYIEPLHANNKIGLVRNIKNNINSIAVDDIDKDNSISISDTSKKNIINNKQNYYDWFLDIIYVIVQKIRYLKNIRWY